MKHQPIIITKIQLALAAKKAGCCRDYRMRILRAKGIEGLLDIYIKGLRWSVQRDYPDIEYITRHFDKAAYNRRGVYISENLEGKEGTHKAIIALGDCTGRLHFGEFTVSRLVAKHNAKFDITADGHAILMVDVLDNASVTVYAKDDARVVLYTYGDAAEPATEQSGNATIKVQNRQLQITTTKN